MQSILDRVLPAALHEPPPRQLFLIYAPAKRGFAFASVIDGVGLAPMGLADRRSSPDDNIVGLPSCTIAAWASHHGAGIGAVAVVFGDLQSRCSVGAAAGISPSAGFRPGQEPDRIAGTLRFRLGRRL
ncbi:hypothetical protein [Accumulibacter sp.]|uniref:hypothetical protein n=1 Tax=Accumulibacter sp. TaxID=2053492 RepID=UPI0025D418DF|nr:hypothetical protein [Accumulibacter sp.]MCM8611692.1 hypothetical protein [Accumulibacter sp.]MCM8635421.1 hypothetical protein [Accumulibacter sp.]MCM8640281.1 hypothetical protein [Accumulibacter sp.]